MAKEIPVYVFHGFLESGKTSFLKEVLEDPNFASGERTLILQCEQGICDCNDFFLQKTNSVLETVFDQQTLTPVFCMQLAQKHHIDRVFLEWNGMWDLKAWLGHGLPSNWMIYQICTTIDASTWELYSSNMGSLMFQHITAADLIVCNRATPPLIEKIRSKNIRAMNPRANIYFETPDGTPMEYQTDTQLPFDIDAPVITISDLDFGAWYVDAMNDPQKYEGKTVKIKGMVYKEPSFSADLFVPGRFAMVCCADDITFIGFVCHSPEASRYKVEEWVTVTATMRTEYYPQYGGEGPVLYATHIERATKPETELVYFN